MFALYEVPQTTDQPQYYRGCCVSLFDAVTKATRIFFDDDIRSSCRIRINVYLGAEIAATVRRESDGMIIMQAHSIKEY